MPSLTARTGTSCKAIKTNLLFFHITKVKIVVQRCLIDVNARTLDTSIQTCSKLFLTLYSPVGHFILLFSTEDLIYKGLKVLGVYKQRIRRLDGCVFTILSIFPDHFHYSVGQGLLLLYIVFLTTRNLGTRFEI